MQNCLKWNKWYNIQLLYAILRAYYNKYTYRKIIENNTYIVKELYYR